MNVIHSNKHRNFKGQLPDEKIVCFTRKHAVHIFPAIIALVLATIVTIALPFLIDQKAMTAVLGKSGFFIFGSILIFCVTYATHFLFSKIFNYYLRIFIVTNERVVDLNKTLFMNDHMLTVMLSEIQDISMDKVGLMQSIFNYGTLNIVVSGTDQTKSIHRIPNPHYHLRKIVQARQEYTNKLASLGGQFYNNAENESTRIQYAPVLPEPQTRITIRSIFKPLPVEAPASDAVLPHQ